MYHRRFRKPSKPAIFAMLMGASALLILLPRDFVAPARDMTQLVALPQYGVSVAARKLSKSASALRGDPVPAAEHEKLLRAKQAVENENIALREQVGQLQNMISQLEGLRRRSNFPAESKLIPARIIGWDAAAGRDSMLLAKGRSSNVQNDEWVASHLAVQAGTSDGVQDDLRVLASESLIGWIDQTSPYVSRMVLLSDRYANRAWRVHVAAVGRDGKSPQFVLDHSELAEFALEGIGDGKMRMHVDARFVNEGLIRVGDVVTSDGRDPKLPLAMVIGEIVQLERIKKQPLLYAAIVKHRCDPKDLGEVLIVDVPR